jgi:hypothetical protein
MTVFVDGIEKYQWPVSTGLRGYSTPSGNFTASSMNKIWYSKQWDNAPMPNAIFFTKEGHAIHGSYETKKLGSAASHGCVRLAPKNAETLFKLVEENGLQNTKVVLAGVTPGGEAKVAEQPGPRYRDADAGPWFGPGATIRPVLRLAPRPRLGFDTRLRRAISVSSRAAGSKDPAATSRRSTEKPVSVYEDRHGGLVPPSTNYLPFSPPN